MTRLIDPSDPQYFTLSSDVPYDRHYYKIVDTDGKEVTLKSWEQVQELWWNTSKQFISHVEVIDKSKKPKGFM